jgi:hypothetical protein
VRRRAPGTGNAEGHRSFGEVSFESGSGSAGDASRVTAFGRGSRWGGTQG